MAPLRYRPRPSSITFTVSSTIATSSSSVPGSGTGSVREWIAVGTIEPGDTLPLQ